MVGLRLGLPVHDIGMILVQALPSLGMSLNDTLKKASKEAWAMLNYDGQQKRKA